MSKEIRNKNIEVHFIEDYYLVIGDCTKKQAIKAIRKTEKKECGMTGSDLYGYENEEWLEEKRITIRERDGEEYFYWGKDCRECGMKNNGAKGYLIRF